MKAVDHIGLDKSGVLEDMGTALDLYEHGLIYKSSRYESEDDGPVFKMDEMVIMKTAVTDVALNNCTETGKAPYEIIIHFVSGGGKTKLVFIADKEVQARLMFDRIKNWLLG